MTEADAKVIADAVRKVLDERLAPILERLDELESRPVPEPAQVRLLIQEELDRGER